MIEPERRGEFDWSVYDRQVKLIQDAGLKWVPFLIFGPGHALPEWWRNSEDHCGMACLEHDKEGWVESVWNPAWRTELSRLLEAFAEHYLPWNVIESVQPGIGGSLVNKTTLLSCAFEHEYGEGRTVYYCDPMNLVPEKDPMFGVGDAFSHILADLLREYAGIEPLGTKPEELGRARFEGGMLIHTHDDIVFEAPED